MVANPPTSHEKPVVTVRAALRSVRLPFIGVAIFSAIINALVLTGSFYMLQVYDRVLPSRSVPTLVGLTILMAMLFACYGALDFARVRALSRIGVAVDRKLRAPVIRAVMETPLRHLGADAMQPVRDLDQVRSFLSGLGPTALFDLPWLPVYIALIYMLHPTLGTFAVSAALLLVVLTIITEFRTRAPSLRSARSNSLRFAFGESAWRNAEVFRAMGLQENGIDRWNALNEQHVRDQLQVSDTSNGVGTVSKVLRLLLQSGILGLGAYLAILGELSAGALIAASIVLSRALAPIELAIGALEGLCGNEAGHEPVGCGASLLTKAEPQIKLPRPVNDLTVSNLFVAPPGSNQPIISGVSFRLEAGDGLGVIGQSAAGKSTLMRSLVGAWPPMPRGGAIRLDGATLDQWTSTDLGRDIGYLPQDIELFDGTISENIARLNRNPPSDTVIAAARSAGVHEMILSLPDGYDTRIGNGGAKLSAGQRQRIALARALYGDPFLVVLDEPSSNLDAEGDSALTEAVELVRRRKGIVIVVAHRPSALAGLNKVLVLSKGQVQAFGPRDEVLKSVLRDSQRTSRREPAMGQPQDFCGVVEAR